MMLRPDPKFRILATLVLLLSVTLLGFDQKPFRFAWLSDTHVGAEGAAETLREVVADIHSISGIQFVLVSGDVTEMGSLEELELAKEILDGLRIPYHIIPGNHDTKWSESGGTDFVRLWGRDHFDFKRRGVRFIGMHQGPVMRMGDGHWAPQDVRWLDKRLSGRAAGKRPIVFVTHYPLDASTSNWFTVLDRLKSFPQIRAVLVGHGHHNRIMDFEGIPGIMGRSTLPTKERLGGYTIVDVGTGEMKFSERLTARETLPPWHAIELEADLSVNQTGEAPPFRPDFSVNRAYPDVRECWRFDTRWTIAAAPAVIGNSAFVCDASGAVRSLRLADGSVKWEFLTKGPVYSTPASDGERVFFGSTDGHIYALDARTGGLIWKVVTVRPVVACPSVDKGSVYVGSSDGIFRALEATTGKTVWRYDNVGGFVETRPLLSEGLVIFGAWDGKLYAIDAETGSLVWEWEGDRPHLLYSPAACWPVAANGRVFIVAPDRRMTAIETMTGRQIWRTDRWAVRESIGISEDGSRIYARTTENVIAAFSTTAAGPELVWELDAGFGYDINSAMLVEKEGTVFYGTKNGLLLAIEGKTGKLLWRHRVGISLINTVAPLSGREVLVTDFDGRVTLVASDY